MASALDDIISLYVDGKFWKSMPYRQGVKAAVTLRGKGKTVEIKF